jgi:hypothetical protein
MSLQLAEKQLLRLYLGFPNEFRYANTRLEGILNIVDDEAVNQIRDLMAQVKAVDLLITTIGITNVGIKQVDEIHFFDGVTQINQQRKAGRILIGRISIILGVPPYSDYYSTTGYLGDSFSGMGQGNGSRHYPLG